MKIVSWNCHYGFYGAKHEAFAARYSDADVFVIQECRDVDFDVLRSLWNHKKWYGDGLEGNLGIAVFSKTWKIEYTTEFNRNFRFVVPFTVSKDNKLITLFAVWTKSKEVGPYYYEENLMKAVQSPEYQNLIKNDVVLIGDFNTASHDRDDTHKEYYNNLVSGLNGFHDCASEKDKAKPTFKAYRDDFCFVSDALLKKANSIDFEIDDNWGKDLSDHCPIIVDIDF